MYVHVVPFTIFALTLVAWCGWLSWDRAAIADRCDQATDDADNALGRVHDIEAHLHGTEPTTGRHARHDWGERAA